MNKKIPSILLVDDDEFMNLLNARLIEKAGVAEHIQVCYTGEEALDYIANKAGDHLQPDLIFLDINMPGINGWEFLEEYRTLNRSRKKNIIVVMLTTSLNPDDEELAGTIAEITEFRHKPLSAEMLGEIMNRYFPAR